MFCGGFYRRKKVASIKILAIAVPLVYILVMVSSHYIFDQRPFVVENIIPLIPHAADNGFPSDHTLISMMAAMTIFFFNKKSGLLLALLAIMVGISRVLVKLHHPLDILGSIAIASISFLIAWLILKKFNQKISAGDVID